MLASKIAFAAVLVFALINSLLLVLATLGIFPWGHFPVQGAHKAPPVTPALLLAILQGNAVTSTALSWLGVAGVWAWRTRTKTDFLKLGFDRDLFKLMVKMKGSNTRTIILRSLLEPKDRLQLAKFLSLDWATVDYHISVLLRNNLIDIKNAYGNVKVFELTALGRMLLEALEEKAGASSRKEF